MQDRKINYLELPASDLNAIQAFYEAVFDWSFTSYGDEYIAFNDGVMDGGFYRTDRRAEYENGSVLVVLYAGKLEEVLQEIVENGGTIVREIFSFPGGRRFHFADPNGNELAVWSDR